MENKGSRTSDSYMTCRATGVQSCIALPRALYHMCFHHQELQTYKLQTERMSEKNGCIPPAYEPP